MSAAYKWFPEAVLLIANPVYAAPVGACTKGATSAWLKFDCGAHPLIDPSSAANKNTVCFPRSSNSDDALNTIPVGDPGPFSPAVGINTFRTGFKLPAPSYKVDHPELLSLTHQGVPGPCTSP